MDDGRRRILLVEDNKRNQRLVGDLLGGRHDLDVVDDGESALQYLRLTAPDLILLDIGLPGIDGFETLRHIRELPGRSQIPVIAVTSYASTTERARVEEAGFEGYVTKPFDVDAFLKIIEAAVKQDSDSQ